MANIWSFSNATDSSQVYANGDVVPHRVWKVLLNDLEVGEMELHLHKRYGDDGRVDLSFGATFVTYGPPPGGK